MPSSSPAQARMMRAVAHGWKKPGGGGPSQAVGKEFMEADMGKQHRTAKMLRMHESGEGRMMEAKEH